MTRPIVELAFSHKTVIEEIIFLGTGCSSSTPLISCLMADRPTCKVCTSAMSNGSKNRRNNPSALIRFRHGNKGRLRNVLIDCGKTFYSSAVQYLVRDKIGPLDGVVLTHGHADAIFGLDDLRHFTGHDSLQSHVDIWLDQQTMDVVARSFPYLVDSSNVTGMPS